MNSEIVQMIITLLGGLAIFIYGMNLMSDGLQKAAGEKMKSILALLTKNPVVGVLAGALTTAVLQSSSATTVMAIGFVSAGAYDASAGHKHYSRSKHRYYDHSAADCVSDRRLCVGSGGNRIYHVFLC